jgi:FtsH-binding integral membrane protein
MSNERRTVLGWAQPYPQPTQPTQPATPEDSQLPPHLTYTPEAPPQGSQVAPLPPRVPPYAAYDQPRDQFAATQPAPDAYRASLAKTQPAQMPGVPPYAQPYAPQPYAQAAYAQPYAQPYPSLDDQQTVVQTPSQQQPYVAVSSQPYPVQPYSASAQQPAAFPHSSAPYAQPYPSSQPYTQSQPPAFSSQPQAPFVRPKSPSGPQAPVQKSKLREKANATVGSSERLRFVRRTYLHLLGAILAFAGLEYLLVTNDFLLEKISIPFTSFALGGRWNWGIVLAVFMVVSWVADYWARHASSRAMQYLGLGFYVIAEALIFVPLLAIVAAKTHSILARGGSEPHILRDSALVTLALFGALTASVFLSRKDFSFLRSGLAMASAAALMLIVLSLVFGFNLGIVFSVAMVLLAAAYILYQTSQVLAHYDPEQHVSAALALFSSVALMFWYVIRIFMKARD